MGSKYYRNNYDFESEMEKWPEILSLIKLERVCISLSPENMV